jgi:hypothetical protein
MIIRSPLFSHSKGFFLRRWLVYQHFTCCEMALYLVSVWDRGSCGCLWDLMRVVAGAALYGDKKAVFSGVKTRLR